MTEAHALVEQWLALGLDPEAPMARATAGPSVTELAVRISSIPREFLDPRLDLPALLDDVLADTASPGALVAAHSAAARIVATDEPDVLAAAAAVLWLHGSAVVVGPYSVPLALGPRFYEVLLTVALRVAPLSPPATWLTSEDAREEMVRTVLWWSGQLPAGEDLATARAMMAVHDSLSRSDTLGRARRIYEHRLEVNRKLREERAREAAQRYTNE